MECPRCHNKDITKLYELNGKYYCRDCIKFHRVFIDETRKTDNQLYTPINVQYNLAFTLTSTQMNISHQLVENYKQRKNSLVLAVCGSGKTEIVFELIQYALNLGHHVCFCVPRKELVIELYERLVDAFCFVDIGLIYGGCQKNIDAQFIICTMHQLYRFENSRGFHLMIADEVDAFPFYGDRVLQELFERCCVGDWVKLSATFSLEDVKAGEELLIMNRRYHGYDLPVPRLIILPSFLQKYILVYLLKKMKKRTIVYVPKIEMVNELTVFLNHLHIKSRGVSSQHTNNQETVTALKKDKIQVIVSTTLLERGMTIEDVQVIVYCSQHPLFDRRTLIQIAGRVGRKVNHPTGKIYFLTSERTEGIKSCISSIISLNKMCV